MWPTMKDEPSSLLPRQILSPRHPPYRFRHLKTNRSNDESSNVKERHRAYCAGIVLDALRQPVG